MKVAAVVPREVPSPEEIHARILARRPGWTPEWTPAPNSPGAAVSRIAARYVHTVLQRLAQAPGKNRLAFFDAVGLRLTPAQAAQLPLVFQLAEDAAAGVAPPGTRVSAPPPAGSQRPILFETERAVGVTPAKLQQVFTLWPGRDEYIDHSAAFAEGEPIRLYDRLLRKPTPHHIYLAHAGLLALAGEVEVHVDFDVKQGAGESLQVLWEYWDGQVWREFLDMNPACGEASAKLDSTAGLTRSGGYTLISACAESKRRTVDGRESFWIRGRLTEPLPPDPGKPLPLVESIRLRSAIKRPLAARLTASPPPNPAPAGAATIWRGSVVSSSGTPMEGAIVQVFPPSTPSNPVVSSPTVSGSFSVALPGADVENNVRVTFRGLEAGTSVSLPGSLATNALTWSVEGLLPDAAFASGEKLDLSKPFFPFGQQASVGSVFYFSSEEIFSKPGAQVRVYAAVTQSPAAEAAVSGESPLSHKIFWEYWNGKRWAVLAESKVAGASLSGQAGDPLLDFTQTEVFELTIPDDLELTTVNEQEALWIRARLASGGYGVYATVTWGDNNENSFTYILPRPPVLAEFLMGYSWTQGPEPADHALAYNDFAFTDHTSDARWPSSAFAPYHRVRDVNPALYLGFDKPLPDDSLGLYFDMDDNVAAEPGPPLIWEAWDGVEWRPLPAEDETLRLRLPGIVSVVSRETVELARFGAALHWLRARLKEDGPPGEATIRAIHPNAVWAAQREAFVNQPLGASSGLPDQVFRITQTPVLEGERIEVRELSGPRAAVEWRILAAELYAGDAERIRSVETRLGLEGPDTDVLEGDLRLRRDRNKRVVEVWVRWTYQRRLFLSGSEDRHYTLDRALGLVVFGDGRNGRIPPPGAAIAAAEFRSGGGTAGNVETGAASQMLSELPGLQAVFNPRPGEGGADGEMLDSLAARGGATIRHRGRAVTAPDFETLAREISPAVGFARALPARRPSLRGDIAGAVTLVIIPDSKNPRPQPSSGLRESVRKGIEERAAADVAGCGGIFVVGPTYSPVDVSTLVAPKDAAEAGIVERRVREALESFFHPLRGGPGGRGWELGRDVYLSDVAAVIERVAGVDYASKVELLRGGATQGDRLDIAAEEMVVAGTLTIRMVAPRG